MLKKLIFTLICSSSFVFGQPGISNVIDVDGVNYYEHEVQTGNTLWGIQQTYNVSADKIIELNPDLTDGLKEGMVILVPIVTTIIEQEKVTSNYKVKSKETLYGLSKKFNTTVDELIALNPELAQGLKKGQIIKVPGIGEDTNESDVTNSIPVVESANPFVADTVEINGTKQEVIFSFSDSTVKHVVLKHETMYSISKRFMISISELMKINDLTRTAVKEGQILIIPVKNENIEKVEIRSVSNDFDSLIFEKKETYNIAFLLPFYLDYGKGYSVYISKLATQFYMGAKIALDSLETMGLNAKIHVFDTKNDSSTVGNILSKSVFKDMDLIIGPLMKGTMPQVATYCKQNKVRMICPVTCDSNLMRENRLVYSTVASNVSLMRELASYMLDNHSKDNIVLIKPLDKKSLPLYDAFRIAFNETQISGKRPNLIESNVAGFKGHIRRGVNTRFVVPTLDKNTAIKFMNNLNRSAFRSRSDDLYVYGTRDWLKFDEVNNVSNNKYNFHYGYSNFVDYYADEMIELNRLYRNRYNTDLSHSAAQAYDVTLFFCVDFFLEDVTPNLMINDFKMKQISEKDGYENSNVFLVGQEEFKLVKIGQLSNSR